MQKLFFFFFSFFITTCLFGQDAKVQYNEAYYDALQWRCIGPFRGGRSAAVTGVEGKPNLYYFGATGGGVWRTKNGGQLWENISDGFFGGSIGAIAVSEYDNNVIYVGGGEVTVRGNVSSGSGMWKSQDAGRTWVHIGLPNSRHIPRVRVHPQNPDVVYAAVLGDLYKPTEERGVYRSKDGGETWQKILYANADAGAVDLVMDPNNPRIMYASTWRVRRTPYSLESGGEGSALWKTVDGGDTWVNITTKEGMPKGLWGISGVAISPVDSDRIWAIIENEEGGVYRSDDGGETWKKVNDSRNLRQRAWYYTRIYADTQDKDGVYVVNVLYHRSKDGGKTFTAHRSNHVDHHDLWIDPNNNQRMIIANDGGAQVSIDGGGNWSTYHNQPTAQFYRVSTDNHFPFRVYGAQQDNTTIRAKQRTTKDRLTNKDFEATAGGESAHITIDPDDNDIVYGGSYGGFLTRYNHRTEEFRSINVWPDNPLGYGAEGMKYRFQWNFPLFFSPHSDGVKTLYAASNHLHKSTDGGQTWKTISPDLTRNDSIKLIASGGPITKDNTGVEYYCTIFAAAESTHEQGVIWTGSDDGLLYLTRDGGDNWVEVTPKELPDWAMINSIEIDPFNKGGLYVAATKYKWGDYAPYLYHTMDYGKTWQKITKGIEKEHFTRVVRADPERKGLLYAGTEAGMYVSFDDGKNWQPLQLNLPIVPITDLAVKEGHLIAATQGRSFWMIDDLTVLHQQKKKQETVVLYKPKAAWRMAGSNRPKYVRTGVNHAGGVSVFYYLEEEPDSNGVQIALYDDRDSLIVKYATDAKEEKYKLKAKKGANYFRWDMHYPGAKKFDGMIIWWGNLNGPKATPGQYKVVLEANQQKKEQPFEILHNPISESSEADVKAQFDFVMDIRDKVSEAHQTIIDIRALKTQLTTIEKRGKDKEEWKAVVEKVKGVKEELTAIEEALYQTKLKSPQDPLNFPIRLTNKLAHVSSLATMGDYKPTQQSYEVKDYLTGEIDKELKKYKKIKKKDIAMVNQLIRELNVDFVE